MDREKVVKGYECCHIFVYDKAPEETSCGICPYKDVHTEEQIIYGGLECIAVLHDDALALLKEQEVVRPVKQIEQTEWTVCSNCRNHIISKWAFCPYCGRVVKWNE